MDELLRQEIISDENHKSPSIHSKISICTIVQVINNQDKKCLATRKMKQNRPNVRLNAARHANVGLLASVSKESVIAEYFYSQYVIPMFDL